MQFQSFQCGEVSVIQQHHSFYSHPRQGRNIGTRCSRLQPMFGKDTQRLYHNRGRFLILGLFRGAGIHFGVPTLLSPVSHLMELQFQPRAGTSYVRLAALVPFY